jgi:hypothetical protein
VDTVDFSNAKPDLFYKYDPMGNRLMKTVDTTETTIYIRDAQGIILSTYQVNRDQFPQHYYQKEVYLYGSSRLGLKHTNILVRIDSSGGGSKQYSSLSDTVNFAFEIGNKSFEMSNHLGNVLATLSDMPLGKDVTGSDTLAEYYVAVVHSAQFYYDFGWGMPDRNYQSSLGYRFGFNGQEKDPDIADGHTTALFWEYDSRVAKRWNVDPRPVVSISPYAVYEGNPIRNNDVLGDTIRTVGYNAKNGFEALKNHAKTILQNPDAPEISRQAASDLLNELEILDKSSVNYLIKFEEPHNTEGKEMGAGGFVSPNKKDKSFNTIDVVVYMHSYFENESQYIGRLAHELKHAFQFEEGKLAFNFNSKYFSPYLYDIKDENESYQRQRDLGIENFSMQFVKKIDENSIREKHKNYVKLPSEQISLSTVDSNNGVSEKEKMSSAVFRSGKAGVAPKFIYKNWQESYEKGKKSSNKN